MIALDRRALLGRLAALGGSMTGLVPLDGCGLVFPSAARPARVPRVGFVGDSPDPPWVKPLWDDLGGRGWVEGETLVVERRPILFANVSNPVGVGVVASIGQPGGNVTGVSNGPARQSLASSWSYSGMLCQGSRMWPSFFIQITRRQMPSPCGQAGRGRSARCPGASAVFRLRG
jgi:hypothetical protein